MAGLMHVDGVDWDNVDLPGSGQGNPLPPGFWPAVVTNFLERTPKSGGAPYIAMEMKVIGTDHDGVTFNDMFHFRAENEVARRIAQSRAKSLAIACGLPAGTDDESKYIGKEVIVEIRAAVNKRTGEPVKNVHAYHNVDRAAADGIRVGPTGQLVHGSDASDGQAAKAEAPPVKSKPWKK